MAERADMPAGMVEPVEFRAFRPQDQAPAKDLILAGLAAQDPYTKIVGPQLTNEPYGLAISKQHPDFVRYVNAVLAQMRADGQWAATYRHWLGSPAPAPPSARYQS